LTTAAPFRIPFESTLIDRAASLSCPAVEISHPQGRGYYN
jgi:hypothetical protein